MGSAGSSGESCPLFKGKAFFLKKSPDKGAPLLFKAAPYRVEPARILRIGAPGPIVVPNLSVVIRQ